MAEWRLAAGPSGSGPGVALEPADGLREAATLRVHNQVDGPAAALNRSNGRRTSRPVILSTEPGRFQRALLSGSWW